MSAVEHPQHYGGEDNPYETIRVIEAWGLGFHLGNAVKYISRAGKKDQSKEREDLEKARWYINRRIEQIANGDAPPPCKHQSDAELLALLEKATEEGVSPAENFWRRVSFVFSEMRRIGFENGEGRRL